MYSWFRFEGGRTPKEFHDRSVETVQRMKECLKTRTLWSCVNDVSIDNFVGIEIKWFNVKAIIIIFDLTL